MSSTRPKSGPLAHTEVRNLANYRSLLPLLLVATVAVALVLIPSAILPARAVGTPAVFVAPLVHASGARGAIVTFWVNVSNMPVFNGFNVMVKVDPAQLSPTSISTTAIMFATPSEDKNCVNDGAGIPLGMPGNIGCVVGLDGPGIAHEEVFCLGCFTTSDHGLLFNVTFTGVATSPTGSVVDLYNVVVDKPPIQVAHIDVDGMYGTTQPDFTIAASPFSQSIAQGRTGSATISLTSLNGFAGTLALNNASVAAGTTNQLPVKLSTTSVALTSGSMQSVGVTISPTPSTAGGVYDLILNASGGSPNLIHATDLNVTVTVPDFSIGVSPISLVNPLGSSNSSTLTLMSINTFTGKVTLSFTVTPIVANSPSITLTNSSHTGSSVTVDLTSGGSVTAMLTVTSTTSTATNSYSIRVTGVSGSLSRSTSVSVSVVPFSISASPVSVSLTSSTGSFATSTLTITSLATSHIDVTLSSSVSPSTTRPLAIRFANATTPSPGVPTLIEGVAAGGTSSLTLNVTVSCSGTPSVCTAVSTYTVKVTGTVGTASRFVNVAAMVTATSASDFTISATSPVNFNAGATGASTTVTVTAVGSFSGAVPLAPSVTPSTGLAVTCPPSVTLPPSPATASCTFSSTTPGVYGVSITGAGGGHTHSASVTVHVGDFLVSATLPSGTAGSSISSTVTLTSTQNFVGSVALSDTPLPAGLTCNPFTVTPVSLTANGTGTSSLSCTSPTAGSFIVNISGLATTGTASHSTSATFTFGPGADFTITATSPADFNTGATGSSTITITPSGGFTGAVSLTTVISPSTGLAANCPTSLTVTSGAVTGTCAPSSSTPGTYLVTITGTGGGHTHSATFISHVGDFSISAGSPVNFNSGATGSAISVSLTSTFNFAGTVSLTAVTSPATGLTVTCPAPVSTTANATVAASCTLASTTAGTYGVTITGAGSPGSASHSASFVVHVGNFTISVGSPVNFNSGATGSAISVSLTSTFNFAGTVTLAAVTSPATGLTVTCPVPVSITANATVAASCTLSSTTAGTYGVTLTGTGSPGTASHSAASTVHVGDFTISVGSPVNFDSAATGSAISVSLTSTFNFAGTVTLAAVTSPVTGLTVTCPAPVSITANATVAASCTLTSTTAGTYGVTITGAGSPGTASHSATSTVHVGDFTISATSPSGV